ncbi:ubiquitin-conjugating enzyme/RWD-like protein [Xylaria flabelliformis]|nr:ubiquitin-conjugating enzyme/RWD-like protein [Xylaria flabelliformis]
MAAIAAGRMMAERPGLEEESTDYKVFFQDDNLLEFDAFIYGPDDSLYKHKLVKLRFNIPALYPYEPPKVTHLQYSGGRIHPNLYVEGNVCLSILGTWPGQPWSPGLSIHTVLISIRALLDNEPYRHEPNCGNHPKYNMFVQYITWRVLLLDHLKFETYGPSKAFIKNWVRAHSIGIMGDIFHQKDVNKDVDIMTDSYSRWDFRPEYDRMIEDLRAAVKDAMD